MTPKQDRMCALFSALLEKMMLCYAPKAQQVRRIDKHQFTILGRYQVTVAPVVSEDHE